MTDIFISYSREDRARAETLATRLGEWGWSVWWDRNIPAGEYFDEVIEAELNAATCVVVLWSASSVASRWVKAEARRAMQQAKALPVLIDDINLPFGMEDLHAAKLKQWQGDPTHPGFEDLVRDIERMIDRRRSHRPAAPPKATDGPPPDEQRPTQEVPSRRGNDLKTTADLTLEEIDQGIVKTVVTKYAQRCPTCSGAPSQGRRNQDCSECKGSGLRQQQQEVQVRFPPGLEDTKRLRVEGFGDEHPDGHPRGDLLISIHELEHGTFQRSGGDVYLKLPVDYTQAALGGNAVVPTVRSRVQMTIPPGTPSGKVFRLRGQGLPVIDQETRGDQLVRIHIDVPQELSQEERRLLVALRELKR